MKHQEQDLSQKKIKRSYTQEQNEFISKCESNINCGDKKQKWIETSRLFQEKFPHIQPKRTPKELMNHFEHSLDKNVKRGKITNDEQAFILISNFVFGKFFSSLNRYKI
jgi:hypothetical protein